MRSAVMRVDIGQHRCPVCDAILVVQKTTMRSIATMRLGHTKAFWPTLTCPNKCRDENGPVVVRSKALDSMVKKGRRFGYDIEVEIGKLRFLKAWRIEDIHEHLLDNYSIDVSNSSISRMAYRFLAHLEMMHVAGIPAIKEEMHKTGGYILHFDSTCDVGRGSRLEIRDSWSGVLLGSWRQGSENAQEMAPHLRYIISRFGPPVSFMKDLSNQGQTVVDEFLAIYPDILNLICHYHFVQDIGKDILSKDHDDLKKLLKNPKKLLNQLIKDTRSKIPTGSPGVKENVLAWFSDAELAQVSMNVDGIAIVRHLAQWILTSANDSSNNRFPFNTPNLCFFHRCVKMADVTAYLINNSKVEVRSQSYKLLYKLHSILSELAGQRKTCQTAASLQKKVDIFARLRSVLAMEAADSDTKRCQTPENLLEFMQKVQSDFTSFVADLKTLQVSNATSKEIKRTCRVILEHVTTYGDRLWGHNVFVTKDDGTIELRFVERTNNVMESGFHELKHNERRRSGRCNLCRDLELRPAAVSLVDNLNNPEYVRLTCGSLDSLPSLFASFDQALDPDLLDEVSAYRASFDTVYDSGRLPYADLMFVRSKAVSSKINRIAQLS